MRRILLAGVALISLAACSEAKKPAAPQARPAAVKSYVRPPKARTKKAVTTARKPARAAPVAEDTTTPRNPLLSH